MASPPVGAILQIQATATTGNVNGAGFNPTATYFNTDLAATVGTTSAPSVTSASYTFVSGDIGSWVYVKSGTNWIAGWYNITNVISGAAILNATIGAAILSISATGVVALSTVTGCVTGSYVSGTASGKYGVDYSQNDSAIATSTTATSSGAGSVILFAGSTQSMLGNYVQIISGTLATPGWYEIIAETAGVSITTDRASTTGIASGITMNIGGAGRLNGAEDAFQAMLPAGSIIFVKNGSYTLSAGISTANTNNTVITPAFWIGYNAVRGDACFGANRPAVAAGANAVSFGVNQLFYNIIWTTTAANGVGCSGATRFVNCKITNSSTTANRYGLVAVDGMLVCIGCEAISQNGYGVGNSTAGSTYIYGSYIHDCNQGANSNGANGSNVFIGNIFELNTTECIGNASVSSTVMNNTFYGREAKVGIGINTTQVLAEVSRVINNIFYGLATGINIATGAAGTATGYANDFFNNTTDVTNWTKDITDVAVNPSFSGASQAVGTVGQGLSGSKFQDSTQNFTTAGVVANRDFLHIVSGGSLTAGCYMVTAITTTTNPNDTLTLNNSPGTGAATAVYYIGVSHNFLPTNTSLKGAGFPSFTNATGSLTTGYPTQGAVQPNPNAGGGGTPILQCAIIQGLGII